MNRELGQLLDLYAGLARRTITDVQRQGGYVTGGHCGRAISARLEITVKGRELGARRDDAAAYPHLRGPHRRRPGDRRAPPCRPGPHRQGSPTSRGVDTSHGWSTSRRKRSGSCGTRYLATTPATRRSSTRDGRAHRRREFGVCPGDYGPREQIMANERWRAGIREMERHMAADRERRRTG